MRHQQRLDRGGRNGDRALDGIRVQIDHGDRLTGLNDLAIHGDQVALCLAVLIVESPGHLLAGDDGLTGGIRALHLGLIAAIRALDRHQLVHAAEDGVRSGGDEVFTHAVGVKVCVLVQLHVGDLLFVQAIGSHQLDVRLAGCIQRLAQTLGAAGQVTGIDAGALDTAIWIIGVLFDQVVVQLDEVGQAALHDIIGIQQQADRVRIGIRKRLEGVKLSREELDETVCHGAHSLDVRAELHLGQAVGRTDAAAQHGGISAIVAGALALGAAGAELHDVARGMGVQTGDTGGLGGDQTMEVHGLQQVGLDEDRTHQITLNAHHLHVRIAHRALRQRIHIALPAVGAQIFAELLAHALGAQPLDVLLIEVVVEQEAGQLALAGADGITLIVRILTEEHIEHQRGVLEPMQEQAVRHGEFVKIHHHCRVVVVLVRDIRHNLDFVHESFPLFFSPALPAGRCRSLACRPIFAGRRHACPVMTGCF